MRLLNTIFCFLVAGCSNNESLLQELTAIPSETAKVIISKHYEPVFHNGEWICGKEYDYFSANHIPDTAYYDKYGNVLLSLCNRIRRYYYYDASRGLLDRKYEFVFPGFSNSNIKEQEVRYIRDEKGLLLATEGHENEIMTYNSAGQRIKIHDKNRGEITTYEYPPTATGSSTRIIIKEIARNELTEEAVKRTTKSFIDTKTGLEQRRVFEYYELGKVRHLEHITYTYDNHNRLIREEMVGKYENSVSKMVPGNIETIYDGTFSSTVYIKKTEYNERGDITLYIYAGDISTTMYKFDYEYNSRGDLVKYIESRMEVYNDNNSYMKSDTELKPVVISTRDITYY